MNNDINSFFSDCVVILIDTIGSVQNPFEEKNEVGKIMSIPRLWENRLGGHSVRRNHVE